MGIGLLAHTPTVETTGFIYDTEALIEHTNLPRKFVERCNAELAPVLDPFRMRGDNNKWLYNSSGLMVFEEIARLKGNQATLPDIERHLASIRIASEATSESSGDAQETSPLSPDAIRALQDAHQAVVAAKEESLRLVQDSNRELLDAKEREITTLHQSIRLLTDGRSPEQLQAERREAKERHQTRGRLVAELRSLERGFFNRRKRRELLDQLTKLESADASLSPSD